METKNIQRTEREEFARHITEENERQNHRLAVLEENTRRLEKLLGYSNTYTNGLAQTEQSKEQQLAQLRSAHQKALTQTQQELARLRAEEAARQQAQVRQTAPSGGGGKYNPTPAPAPEPEPPKVVKPGSITGVAQNGSAIRGNKIHTSMGQTLK